MARKRIRGLTPVKHKNRHQTNHTFAPKETIYGDHTFRSRLEARWAIVFDVLGFQWEYEPEVFRTPYGGYLPDFRVTPPGRVRSWVEVKGPEPVAVDYLRAESVAHKSSEKFRFLVGGFPSFEPGSVRAYTAEPYGRFVRAEWEFGATEALKDRAVFLARHATWTEEGEYIPYEESGVWSA